MRLPTLGFGTLNVGAGFDPLSLSPALWLRADAGLYQDTAGTTPADEDADPVGLWQDQSGNARHFEQGTAGNRPTLKLAIQNGLPVIRFDGSDDRLSGVAASRNLVRNVGGCTVVAVCSSGATSERRMFMASTNALANSARLLIRRNFPSGGDVAVAARRLDADSSTSLTVSGVISASEFNLQTAIVDYANSNADIYLDGVSVASSTSYLTDGSSQDSDSADVAVGSGGTGPGWNGDIGELLIFQRALSTDDRVAIETYLRTRWGTP